MTLRNRMTSQTVGPKVRLLDSVRQTIRRKHYSLRTESTYIDWIKRYILFHRKRHPAEMGAAEMEQFLNHLAGQKKVAASIVFSFLILGLAPQALCWRPLRGLTSAD